MRLRSTFHLADGAAELFEAWIAHLNTSGLDVVIEAGVDSNLDADIVFACGLLTATKIRQGARRRIVCAPIFDGETAPVYRSVIVARSDRDISDLRNHSDLRLAVNEYGSWSGWHGFKEHLRTADVAPTAIGDHVMSGGHVASIEAVIGGRADIASIDHSVWNARLKVDSRLSELSVVDTTRDWPAPPVSLSESLPSTLSETIVAALLELPGIAVVDAGQYDFMLAEVENYPHRPA